MLPYPFSVYYFASAADCTAGTPTIDATVGTVASGEDCLNTTHGYIFTVAPNLVLPAYTTQLKLTTYSARNCGRVGVNSTVNFTCATGTRLQADGVPATLRSD